MEDLRSGIERLKQAKAHMREVNGIVSDCISQIKELEEENAGLRAKLDDWKGNAEGFQPDAYMKLPLDADGEPIRIGDEMDIDGEIAIVKGYQISYEGSELLFIAVSEDDRRTFTLFCKNRKHFKHDTMPVDSWEKLEEDARKTPCDYACAPLDSDGLTTCDGCRLVKKESCYGEMTLEVLERAKKLAGIEEEG